MNTKQLIEKWKEHGRRLPRLWVEHCNEQDAKIDELRAINADLLAALQTVVKHHADFENMTEQAASAMRLAHAAIAKATQ